MKIVGARPSTEFTLTCKPSNQAAATFVTIHGDEIHVSRCAAEIAALPDDTPVVAHWHGAYRTDGFAMTAAELKQHIASWQQSHTR